MTSEFFTGTGSIEDPICTGCNRRPPEISEYSEDATQSGMDPTTYVIREEGTFNPQNGHFLCTDCYIKAGMPVAPGGWVAP
jgi:hypothetical protein